jgi:hypothetical protein
VEVMRRLLAAYLGIVALLGCLWQAQAQLTMIGIGGGFGGTGGGAPAATDILDFAGNTSTGCASLAACTSITNSAGFAQTSTGTLTSFSANALRRTDLGVLVEAAATNLCTQSQTLDNAAWTLNDLTVTANATTAPDGTATAELFTDNSNNVIHRFFSTGISFTSGTTYTTSVYLKGGTLRFISVRHELTSSGPVYAWLTLDTTNGTIANNGATATYAVQALANGWYRVSIVGAAGATFNDNLLIAGSNVSTAPGQSSAGNVYVGSGQTFSAWGAQVEVQSSAPTSYITTTTTSVTRNADVLTITGQAQTDLKLSAYSTVVQTTTPDYLAASPALLLDAVTGGSDKLIYAATNTTVGSISSDSTTLAATLGSGTFLANTVKSGIAVDGTGRSLAANNGTVTSDAKTFGATGTPTLGGAANYFNGYMAKLSIWNTKLSNANLALATQ